MMASGSDPKRHPRARAKAPGTPPDVIIAQVEDIATIMAAGAWVFGETEKTKMQEWGVTLNVVRDRAAEARRFLAMSFSDREELRGLLLAQLDGIAGEQRKSDPKAAVAALREISNVAGLQVQKHEVTVSEALPPWHDLPVPQQLAKIDTAIAKLCQMRDTLLQRAPALPASGESVDVGTGQDQGSDG